MSAIARLKRRAGILKADSYALFLAARHPGTPWYAKLLVAAVVAYALSPVDLIPDFIPVLGWLDDLVVLPLGIALAIRLIPPPVLAECRVRAAGAEGRLTRARRIARGAIVGFWLAIAVLLGWALYRLLAAAGWV